MQTSSSITGVVGSLVIESAVAVAVPAAAALHCLHTTLPRYVTWFWCIIFGGLLVQLGWIQQETAAAAAAAAAGCGDDDANVACDC
jgi:hypothetical protein